MWMVGVTLAPNIHTDIHTNKNPIQLVFRECSIVSCYTSHLYYYASVLPLLLLLLLLLLLGIFVVFSDCLVMYSLLIDCYVSIFILVQPVFLLFSLFIFVVSLAVKKTNVSLGCRDQSWSVLNNERITSVKLAPQIVIIWFTMRPPHQQWFWHTRTFCSSN